MSASSSTAGSSAAAGSRGKGRATSKSKYSKKSSKNRKRPGAAEKSAQSLMVPYQFNLTLPFYSGEDDDDLIQLAYLDLPSESSDSSEISHKLVINKVNYRYVPCTFKTDGDQFSWPLVRNKAQSTSSFTPESAELPPPALCEDCTVNERPNLKIDTGNSDFQGIVQQTKLDDKHSVVLLFHISNRFYPFCMEFTYSDTLFMQVSVGGWDYNCSGTQSLLRMRLGDCTEPLLITVYYHNLTYVIEHPGFHFGNSIDFKVESKIYKIKLTESNMRALPNPTPVNGDCYFKTIQDSTGDYTYYFLTQGSDRELEKTSQEPEPVFSQEEWSHPDQFKARITSLKWVGGTLKVDDKPEYLKFGVSGTVVVQSTSIHKTHRLFKPFLMTDDRAFILEKMLQLGVLCTSL